MLWLRKNIRRHRIYCSTVWQYCRQLGYCKFTFFFIHFPYYLILFLPLNEKKTYFYDHFKFRLSEFTTRVSSIISIWKWPKTVFTYFMEKVKCIFTTKNKSNGAKDHRLTVTTCCMGWCAWLLWNQMNTGNTDGRPSPFTFRCASEKNQYILLVIEKWPDFAANFFVSRKIFIVNNFC